jgi:hypothetical protein
MNVELRNHLRKQRDEDDDDMMLFLFPMLHTFDLLLYAFSHGFITELANSFLVTFFGSHFFSLIRTIPMKKITSIKICILFFNYAKLLHLCLVSVA